jgi:anti-anti-sigma regulatory factor
LKATRHLLSQELATLGLDFESSLEEGPRALLDARFLGALHMELGEQLGPRKARTALLQLGFLHGLRDAALVLRSGFGTDLALGPHAPAAPHLAIRVAPNGRGPGSALRFMGSWPEQHEAEAVAAALGGAREPSCHLSAGYTSGWLSGLFDGDVVAVEQACSAAGHAACCFEATETSAWQAREDRHALGCLEALPFQALRETVARHLETHPPPRAETHGECFEAGAPVVHVWGPVTVIPFSGPDESLRALELIGRDPGARQVRVVIVDLSGTLIDDGFGASALEQILEAIESWGAEPILSGVSPLSAPVVTDLERTHLILQKDLPDAIAAGFQIAEAQRRAS